MRVQVDDDVRLYVDVDGCGLVADGESMVERPVLLLLHGGPGADHTLFKPEFAAITDVAQVVYLDQRGSGRSDRGEPRDWTWERWADDVAAVADALGLPSLVLVGTSSGGLIALTCAARHPELVAGLVLDSSLGAPTTLEENLELFERRGGLAAREAAERYLGGDRSAAAEQAWQTYGLPLYASVHDGGMAIRRARARINPEVQEHFRADGCGPITVEPVHAPALILAGADDPITPAAGAYRLADQLTGAPVRVEVLADVGHGVFRQAPDLAFAELRKFLAELTVVE